jgi:sugar lactone lactonase YvrE
VKRVEQVEHVLSVQNELGEGPLWVTAEQALYWVDIAQQRIFRYRPADDAHQVFEPGVAVTVLAPRAAGGFVAGTAGGFAFWSPGGGLEVIANPEAARPHIRFNDGATDARGRFWAGTMNGQDAAQPDGSLFRLDPDRSVQRIADGFTVYNGTAFSPDWRTMYYTDTFRRVILACDFDLETGTISRRRHFVHVPEDEGYPDGHCVDSEGYLWSTHWGGWRISRYDPDGRKEREIRLPVANVTCCAFGGPLLDELYVTTAWLTLDDAARRQQPLAGDLFRIRTGIKGLERPPFAG